MKSCPACNRTYSDETLAFCLEDGSLLSAPYDSEETRLLSSAPPDTDSILTKISSPATRPADTMQQQPAMTMPSPQMRFDHAENKASYQPQAAGTGGKIWLGAGFLVFLTICLAAALVWFNAIKLPANTGDFAKNQTSNQSNSNDLSQKDKRDDTIFGPLNYQASLNGENLTYYPATTIEKCQSDCAKDERCRGFTFIRAGAYNPNDSAMCYLASFVKESVFHVCCVSGIKR